MTYMVDITLSLVRVLDQAAFFRDERLKGYAANARFWADEVRHALDVLAGHESRQFAWREALPDGPSSNPISPADLTRLSKRLKFAATRLFRLCRPHLDRATVIEIEQLLGIHIEQDLYRYGD